MIGAELAIPDEQWDGSAEKSERTPSIVKRCARRLGRAATALSAVVTLGLTLASCSERRPADGEVALEELPKPSFTSPPGPGSRLKRFVCEGFVVTDNTIVEHPVIHPTQENKIRPMPMALNIGAETIKEWRDNSNKVDYYDEAGKLLPSNRRPNCSETDLYMERVKTNLRNPNGAKEPNAILYYVRSSGVNDDGELTVPDRVYNVDAGSLDKNTHNLLVHNMHSRTEENLQQVTYAFTKLPAPPQS